MTIRSEAIDAETRSRVNRNIDLARRFTLAIFEAPVTLDELPDGTTLVLLPDHDPDLAESNLQRGSRMVRAGQDVAFRHVRSPERVR